MYQPLASCASFLIVFPIFKYNYLQIAQIRLDSVQKNKKQLHENVIMNIQWAQLPNHYA